MFGSKQARQERLRRAVALLAAHGELSPTELADRLGVHRKVVYGDLVALENAGVYLQEHNGKLSLFHNTCH